MKKYTEDLTLDLKDYSELSYDDLDEEYIHLLFNGKTVGLVEISTDVENQNREYIIVNHEIIYLDTIKSRV